MHRSALPVAVRGTLNRAAFDVKKNTMPAAAKTTFIERKPTFFKANSKVAPAVGFDVRNMKATVGFTPKGGTDQSVDDLEQQERGGSIGGRAFIPLAQARAGGSWRRNVKASARISDIKNKVVDSRRASGRSSREEYIKSAVHAGKGGWLIGNRVKGGNKYLFQVRSLKRIDGRMMVKAVPMFAVKRRRKVNPKATHFMQQASTKSAGQMETYYAEEAKKQFAKLK